MCGPCLCHVSWAPSGAKCDSICLYPDKIQSVEQGVWCGDTHQKSQHIVTVTMSHKQHRLLEAGQRPWNVLCKTPRTWITNNFRCNFPAVNNRTNNFSNINIQYICVCCCQALSQISTMCKPVNNELTVGPSCDYSRPNGCHLLWSIFHPVLNP